MIRFFVTRPSLVFVMVLTVVVTGLVSIRRLTKELWPPVAMNMVTVGTAYPGASAEEVEQLVTIPIEDELSGLEDVDYIESTSAEGSSTIAVYYAASVSAAAMDDKERDVQQRVNRVQNLPGDASTPYVNKIATTNMPIAIYALSGPPTELAVKQLADEFRDELEQTHGVKSAWTSGAREREIRIRLDPQRLEAFGITAAEVLGAVAARHVDLPAGSLFVGRDEYLLRVLGKPRRLGEFGDIVLRREEGANVVLADVATIEDGFKDASVLAHLNGRRSVLVQFSKEDFASTTDLVNRADDLAAELQTVYPGVRIAKVFDTGIQVAHRMRELLANGAQGFVLVVLILWFQLGLRRAVIVAAGIPFSFLGTFILMQALGISINFMTLYGIFIVLGILVDDAIVVVENITRHAEQGESPRRASIVGARQVAMPVIVAVSTTVVAFSTMLLMTGTIGRFMGFLPKVVILVLCWSVIEALLFAPAHVAEWISAEQLTAHHRSAGYRLMLRMQDLVESALRFLLRRPRLAFLLPPSIVIVSLVVAARTIQIEMFPDDEPTEVYITYELPAGSALSATEEVAGTIHRDVAAMAVDDIVDIYAAIGYSIDGWGAGGKNVGQVICVLRDRSEREQSGFVTGEQIRERLEGRYPLLTRLKVAVPDSGPPTGSPVLVRVLGDDFAVLEPIAEEIKAWLGEQPGTINIDDDRREGNPELQIRIDEDKCGRTGVDFTTVALTCRTMFIGLKADERRMDDEAVDITVAGPPELRELRAALEQVTVPSISGRPVPLTELVKIERAVGPRAVFRRDGDHVITVTADIRMGLRGPEANSAELNGGIRERFARRVATEHPGYRIEFGGEAEEQAESFGSLAVAFVAAAFLIYVILVVQFNRLWQPLVIMFVVPMSIVGVIWGMLIFGETFNLSTMIGIVALCGIAVNDAVVYVDYINHLRQNEGYERDAALIEAARTRLRPIFLTSLTTICGLLPMALRIGGGSAYLSPLASAICYGLVVQTVSTVTFIPVAFRIMEGLSERCLKLLHRVMPRLDPRDVDV